jgi:hypothetical protein
LALDIWDRFDHQFINDLISETVHLRKLEDDKPNNEVTEDEIKAVKDLYSSSTNVVTPSGKTLEQLANFDF